MDDTTDALVGSFMEVMVSFLPIWQGEAMDEAPARAVELLHTEFELVEADSLPFGGTWRGADGVLALSKRMHELFDLDFGVPEFKAVDDTLFVSMTLSGRVRATGTPFSVPVLERWEFRDGRPWRATPFYFDTAALCAACDPVPGGV
jgi:ketosteroid isomerase-like protein